MEEQSRLAGQATVPPAAVNPSVTDCKFKHRRTNGEVWRCKRGHRSELDPSEWGKFGYAWRGEEVISRPIQTNRMLPIPRLRRSEIGVEEFYERFAIPGRPCIIEGAMNDWPAMERWDIDRLLSTLTHASLKVGEDDKGRKLRMKYKYFVDYMRHQRDDSPLYLFETRVEHEPQARRLLDDFTVPDFFPHDFFDLVNSHSKPPYRWWSIGPRRSGTTVHSDPLGTAAWNAVTHGRKRWVLFEPSVPGRFAKGKDVINKDTEDDEPIMYFDFILPRILEKHPEIRVYEAEQGPGDVIFVPSQWWHGVLNLEDTVGVTQNYCGYDNFDLVWMRTRRERKKLAHLWLRNMRKFAPHLHARAIELNRRDNFRMRHERGSNETDSSSDDSSSSSSSSSDSSTDEEKDLDLSKVHANVNIMAPWLVPARPAAEIVTLQPPVPSPPPLAPGTAVLRAVAGDSNSVQVPPRKRPHVPTATPQNSFCNEKNFQRPSHW